MGLELGTKDYAVTTLHAKTLHINCKHIGILWSHLPLK